jgi:hypothetical protein
MPLDLEWNRQLNHRRGADRRLGGIDVYHDFEWRSQFSDQRTQFRNGECMAANVQGQCPPGKTPALLLTDQDDVDEGYRETPRHLVFVLNLPRYLHTYADPSLAYQAHRLGGGLTQLGPLNERAGDRVRAGAAVLEAQIDFDQIAAWAGEDGERLGRLRELAGGEDRADLGDVLDALAGLGEELDSDAVARIGALFGPGAERERRLELLRAIAADPDGRYLTGEVMLEELPRRIDEAREALADYRALLGDPGSGETDLQEFIEERLWLLGLEYVKFRARRPLIRGTADFILERVDGFHDLLELKDPQDKIVVAPDANDGVPPPANKYALSPALAKALAQSHVYRHTLTSDDRANEQNFGLRDTRDPRLVIVIGRAGALPEHRLQVLRELNKSLHRVEVVPYDALGDRAERVLDNVEKYLSVADAEASESGAG